MLDITERMITDRFGNEIQFELVRLPDNYELFMSFGGRTVVLLLSLDLSESDAMGQIEKLAIQSFPGWPLHSTVGEGI